MKRMLVSAICCSTLLAGCLSSTGNSVLEREPRCLADQYYYVGPEGNAAYSIGAKFNSRKEMADLLRLDASVGEFANDEWALADILISADFNGNGDIAVWEVSGPKPLLDSYISRLRRLYETGSAFYDFGANPFDVRPTAYWEQSEE